MMNLIVGVGAGAGLAYVATKLPNIWFIFPIRFVLFGAGMILIGSSLFSWFLMQGNTP